MDCLLLYPREVELPCNSSNDTTECSFKNEPPKAHTEAEQLRERIDEGVGRKLRQGRQTTHRTVRQETTMFKAGTLPLNMYATSVTQNEKVTFQTRPSEAPVDVEQNEQQEDAA